MGLISYFKEKHNFRKAVKEAMKNIQDENERYLNMTADELKELEDDDLYEAVIIRTEDKVDKYENIEEALNALSQNQKIFYCVSVFESEVNNGGLCQFFVNSSRVTAPYISEYLKIVGSDAHKKLFDNFITENKIDVSELSSFIIYDEDEFEKQSARYPFDKYDDEFYNTEPLQSYLIEFIRKHLEDF